MDKTAILVFTGLFLVNTAIIAVLMFGLFYLLEHLPEWSANFMNEYDEVRQK